MSEVTRILSVIEQGDTNASAQLLPLVYAELRNLAAAKLSDERPGQTLQATALVHEAYIRLVDVDQTLHWNSRCHFFAAAAEAMRRILVERARSKQRLRAGGDYRRVDIQLADLAEASRSDKLLALDEALGRFEDIDFDKAQLVKFRYFAGMTNREAAKVLGVSTSTADRYWTYARAWLQREIGGPGITDAV